MARVAAAVLCLLSLQSTEGANLRTRQSLQLSAAANTSASSFLQSFAAQCQCTFRDTCSCKGTAALMQCIASGCSTGACDCEGYHFDNACRHMANLCPVTGLACSAGVAECTDAEATRTAEWHPATHRSTINTKPVKTPAFRQGLAEALDGIIAKAMAKAPAAPGFSAVAVLDGDVIWKGALGTLGVHNTAPATTESIWHWASVSKSFTAIAVMILYEEGRLDLDDPVVKHVPYFKMLPDPGPLTPNKTGGYETMTVKHLLTHNSGLGDVKDHYNFEGWPYEKLGGVTGPPCYDEACLQKWVTSWGINTPENQLVCPMFGLGCGKLMYEPGSGTEAFECKENYLGFSPCEIGIQGYSNLGYDLLGAVVEEVSGMSFEEFTKTRIFEPLGMKDSSFLYKEDAAAAPYGGLRTAQPGVPKAFDPNTGTITWNAPRFEGATMDYYPYNRRHNPSGGLSSSIEDMAQWLAFINGYHPNPILKAETVNLVRGKIVSSQWSGKLDWSLGFRTKMTGFEDLSSETVTYKGGEDVGFKAETVWFKNPNLAIATITNWYEGGGSYDFSKLVPASDGELYIGMQGEMAPTQGPDGSPRAEGEVRPSYIIAKTIMEQLKAAATQA